MPNKEKPIVLVDMDGVLVDYMSHLLSVLKHGFQEGLDPELENMTYNKVVKHKLEDMFFCTRTRQYIKSTLYIPGMFTNPLPIPGAVEAVKFLAEYFEIFICSSPFSGFVESDHGWSEKVTWIRRYLGKEWVDKLILTRDKTLVYGEVLIDDKPEIRGVRIEPAWQHLLFYQPWNKHLCLRGGSEYIPNWSNPEQIVEQIQRLIKERFKCMPE